MLESAQTGPDLDPNPAPDPDPVHVTDRKYLHFSLVAGYLFYIVAAFIQFDIQLLRKMRHPPEVIEGLTVKSVCCLWVLNQRPSEQGHGVLTCQTPHHVPLMCLRHQNLSRI